MSDPASAPEEILRTRARQLARPPAAAATEATVELLEFRLADERYAVESECVREVCPFRDLVPLPQEPVDERQGRAVPRIREAVVMEHQDALARPAPKVDGASRALLVEEAERVDVEARVGIFGMAQQATGDALRARGLAEQPGTVGDRTGGAGRSRHDVKDFHL